MVVRNSVKNTPLLLLGLMWLGAVKLNAQAVGAITGIVRETGTDSVGLAGARVSVDGGRFVAVTDRSGAYRLREVPVGWHVVAAAAIGHRALSRDSVLVRSGQTTPLDFRLQPDPVGLAPIEVVAEPVDSVLDAFAVVDAQRFTAEELHRLPVSTVDEAIALSAGAVGESYRGGRLGQQAFVIDGLGLKNQLDASTGENGLRLPPDMLAEAALITNGFSARYGQALSALVNLVTRDGGNRWRGRVAYETDRPLGNGWDRGLDRGIISADGPIIAGITFVGAADISGRLDADPVNAPTPSNPLDPRHDRPWLLPHNSGEQYDLSGKLTIPIGRTRTLRLLGVRSYQQRLLYDPAYKYDTEFAPIQQVDGRLLTAHLQEVFERQGLVADLRLGYLDREFLRGSTSDSVDYSFGAFTGNRLSVTGQHIAKSQDTTAARGPIAGFVPPDLSDRTPWGVPAFFLGGAPSGDIAWNQFKELRARLDLSFRAGANGDFYVGAEAAGQRVRTFQRVLGYLPAGDSVPSPSAARFSPSAEAVYAEAQYQKDDLALTFGLRYDQFSGRDDLPGKAAQTSRALSPRAAVSTVLKGATVVASYGQFRQAPDYQYLIDAAFDDTTRTGRFRQGNPDLGFEKSTQYELSLRVRPTSKTSLKANLFVRRLNGLVGSVPFGVNPDSSFFANSDAGSVKGIELIFERPLQQHVGFRASYTLQSAQATSTSAFLLRESLHVDPISGDTTFPARVEFPLDYDRRHALVAIVTADVPPGWGPSLLGTKLLAGLEATAVLRVSSGLPYTRTDASGDTLVGLPNESRLPATKTFDLLVRRPLHWRMIEGSVYLDLRNLLNTRNIVAVRRDTGSPRLGSARLNALADSAYAAHPEPIPYESPRYRGYADLDHNGYVEGENELRPMFLAAARDFFQPIFAYGTPRLVRLGLELVF